MCRLLIISSKKEFDIYPYLIEFVKLSEKSLTPDGDRQKDGWGLFTKKQFYKSTKPIWEDEIVNNNWLKDNLLIIHIRSAFKGKDNLEFNQPFVNNGLIFVFNGLLKGVKIKCEGEIGSQKIFNLIQKIYKENRNNYLENFYQLISKETNYIVGMNIIVIDLNFKKINLISVYNEYENYFALNLYQDDEKIIICSEKFNSINFEKLSSETIKTLDLK